MGGVKRDTVSRLSKTPNFDHLHSYEIGSALLARAVIPVTSLFLITTGDTITTIACYNNFVTRGIARKKVV